MTMTTTRIYVVVMPAEVRDATGVESATQATGGAIRLHYSDGHQEMGLDFGAKLTSSFDRPEDIIHHVVSKRPHTIVTKS
jgi:hypothetical protein